MSSAPGRAASAARGADSPAAASARSWSTRRVEWRLAARQARRAWPTSLMVIALVALPLALLSGAAVFMQSRTATAAQEVSAELGGAGAWYAVIGGPDPSRSQSLSQPYWYEVDLDDSGVPIHPELPAPDHPADATGEESLLRVATADVTIEASGGPVRMVGEFGDSADPLLDGRYELIDGARPRSEQEVVVSPGALARLHAQIGDELVVTDAPSRFTIVGVMKATIAPSAEQTVFLPASAAPGPIDPLRSVWFSPAHQPTAAEIEALNHDGVIVYARDLVAAGIDAAPVDAAAAWSTAAMYAIIGAFVAYLVILLAGAGFAVSARRQQHALAVAASVGAARGSVFRIVLLQGTVLGTIGGLAGALLGAVLAYPVLALLDDGAASSFWGFRVPAGGLALLVVFAAAIGTASALVPARAATRGDVLASLRGARAPALVRANRPLWGSIVITLGLAATAASAAGLTALNAADEIDYSTPWRTLCVIGIVSGPLLFQIGVILAGHWLLASISRIVSRAPLALRIATRDAAAHPSRIVPAFAAIAACVFIASFALSAVGVFMQQQSRNWSYQAPLGSVVVSIWAGQASPIIDQARTSLEQTSPDAIGVVREAADSVVGADTAEDPRGYVVYPELAEYADCTEIEGASCMARSDALFNGWSASVVEPLELETVLGVPIADDVRTAFADGGALALPIQNGWADAVYLDDDAIILNVWDPRDIDAYWTTYDGQDAALPDPLRTLRVPAQEIALEHPLPWPVILSPAAADALDYRTVPRFYIGAYATPPSAQQLDPLALAAGQYAVDDGSFDYYVERGAPDAAGWLWLILAAAGVLVLGAAGVALGLARVERRPDDATLTAVGASPAVRRAIAFWQAIVVVGIGSVTGTAAGLIPMWGITMQSQPQDQWALRFADAPWVWLMLLAAGIPVLIAAVGWLIPPRRADLTRRTVIA